MVFSLKYISFCSSMIFISEVHFSKMKAHERFKSLSLWLGHFRFKLSAAEEAGEDRETILQPDWMTDRRQTGATAASLVVLEETWFWRQIRDLADLF